MHIDKCIFAWLMHILVWVEFKTNATIFKMLVKEYFNVKSVTIYFNYKLVTVNRWQFGCTNVLFSGLKIQSTSLK